MTIAANTYQKSFFRLSNVISVIYQDDCTLWKGKFLVISGITLHGSYLTLIFGREGRPKIFDHCSCQNVTLWWPNDPSLPACLPAFLPSFFPSFLLSLLSFSFPFSFFLTWITLTVVPRSLCIYLVIIVQFLNAYLDLISSVACRTSILAFWTMEWRMLW